MPLRQRARAAGWLLMLGFVALASVHATPVYAQGDAGEAPQAAKKRKRKPRPEGEPPAAKTPIAPPAAATPPPLNKGVPASAGKAPPGPVATAPKPTESAPAAGSQLDLLPELTDTTPPLKVAITSFVVEGDEIPAALVYQLQDGFILGLVRAGVRVIDTEDLKHMLQSDPDLLTCETSPCVKRLGQLVGVRHVAKVNVQVTGNSYRMSARIYSTTGSAPGAMPIETQSRFCDVCTVTEARETMLRLADGIRVADDDDETGAMDLSPPPPPPPAAAYLSRPASAVAIISGAAGILLGTVLMATSGDGDKALTALGGGLMGAGALSAAGGILFYISGDPRPATSAGTLGK